MNRLQRYLKGRKGRKMAMQYIKESSTELQRVFCELATLALEAAVMIEQNKESEKTL